MCVIMISKNGRVTAAADSATMGPTIEGNPTMCEMPPDTKIFQPTRGVLIAGFSTVAQVYFQAIQEMEWPAYRGEGLVEWLRQEAIPAMSRHYKAQDLEYTDPKNGIRMYPLLLVGTAEGLAVVSADGAVTRMDQPFMAHGRGAAEAWGFLLGSQVAEMFDRFEPAELCGFALAAAAQSAVGVGFSVDTVEMDENGTIADRSRRPLVADWARPKIESP